MRFKRELNIFMYEMERVLNNEKNSLKESDLNKISTHEAILKYVEEFEEFAAELWSCKRDDRRAKAELIDLANALMMLYFKL